MLNSKLCHYDIDCVADRSTSLIGLQTVQQMNADDSALSGLRQTIQWTGSVYGRGTPSAANQ